MKMTESFDFRLCMQNYVSAFIGGNLGGIKESLGLSEAFALVQNAVDDFMRTGGRSFDDLISVQVRSLLEYIQCFSQLRINLIAFFSLIIENETALSCSASKFSEKMEDVFASYHNPSNCLDSVLSPLIDIIREEVAIILPLLKIQCQIGNLEFLNSLLSLKHVSLAFSKLESENKAVRTALHDWLKQAHSALLAKFSLYWYAILRKWGPSTEVEQTLSTENPDLVRRIQSFVTMHGGSYAALFFDAYLQDFPYLGHSYVPPGAADNRSKGPTQIPCIFTMPPTDESNKLNDFDHAIIMREMNSLISVDAAVLPRKIVAIFDSRLEKTFFVVKIEPRIFSAVVLPNNVTENGEVKDFVTRLADSIQLVNLSRALLTYQHRAIQ